MFTSFNTALSALNAQSTAIDVVGNNLANINTTGFKASTIQFRDLVAENLGVGSASTQIGAGVNRPLTFSQYVQGGVQVTNNPLDAAIQGNGFFVVKNTAGQSMYTRAGNFHVDPSGYLVTSTGEHVQGWTAAGGIANTSGATGDLQVPAGTLSAPKATTTMSLDGNLNAVGTATTFSTPIQVVDSLGTAHTLTVTFNKTDANKWSYDVTLPGEDLASGAAGTPSKVGSGTLEFDANGQLTAPAAGKGEEIKLAGLSSGAADQTIAWNLYGTDGTATLTQFAQASGMASTSQDGSFAAEVLKVSIGDNGALVAQYSNGEQKTFGQLALASIRNPESLVSVGNSNLALGADSAAAVIGAADTGGRGKILGESVEASTVDIAHEFTNLIVYQRGYQANSKVITTTDELTQETLNLKR